MALPNSSTAPLTSEYAGDEVSAIVLDPGYWTTRAGFAGEDVPKSVIPTHYGTIEKEAGPQYLYGENAIHTVQPDMEVKNPWSTDGIVEDWERASKIWEYSITSRLTGTKPTNPLKNGLNDPADGGMDVEMEGMEEQEKSLAESPLLMTEPSWNPGKAREKYIEIAMEDWGTPAFWLGKNGVLAAFASGKATALVIDIGASMTSITPVVDGMILKKGIQKSSIAGNYISNQIRLSFAQAQPPVPLTPHYMVASKTPVEAGAPAQATYVKFQKEPTASFRRFQEERVLTEFKESVVQVWPGPGRFVNTSDDLQKSLGIRPFEMPDGWNQVFGPERHKVVECLFDANAAYTDEQNPRPRDDQTLPTMIQASLNAVDVESRPNLLANVVVTGAGSLLHSFTERLNLELTSLFPAPRVRISAPGLTVERKYAPWIGGSILASLGSFHQLWISKKEYEEHGPSIVEKRCK